MVHNRRSEIGLRTRVLPMQQRRNWPWYGRYGMLDPRTILYVPGDWLNRDRIILLFAGRRLLAHATEEISGERGSTSNNAMQVIRQLPSESHK
jgi:hypothetical protein